MTLTELFFALIRYTICGKPLPEKAKLILTEHEDAHASLFALAKKHDLAHLICEALDQNGLLLKNKIGESFDTQRLTAIFRYEQLHYDFEELCETLEKAGIDYMPLKGAMIRQLYPEPWMRTSCDVDILVKDEDFERTTQLFLQNANYVLEEQTSNVNAFAVSELMHIELHRFLLEFANNKQFLPTVWAKSTVKETAKNYHEMDKETLYAHHVAHMAKHVVAGGCGVRAFLDIWLLKARYGVSAQENSILKENNLEKFAVTAEKLSSVWFDGEAHDELTKSLEDFILDGGLYGNEENSIAVKQVKKGGKFGYFCSLIFLPFEELSWQYPNLKKHKWMFPFYQIRRWFRILFKGMRSSTKQRLQTSNSITKQQREDVAKLLKDLDL